uniref:Uncharacterized protein n=1 Tax=Anopheles albimanus TaxID=7167 RepID=A0A182FJV2_ANOAL
MPSTLQNPLPDASGSTPMAAHICWNWRRNWVFFLISFRCLAANSSSFSRSASICWSICSNWESCNSVPLSLYFSACSRCFWMAPIPARFLIVKRAQVTSLGKAIKQPSSR